MYVSGIDTEKQFDYSIIEKYTWIREDPTNGNFVALVLRTIPLS